MTSSTSYISRLFALLDCFSPHDPELGVREAARMLNISSSSCGRMMSEMRNEGVLTQNPETKLYSLGGRVIRWAGVYVATSDLCSKSMPMMKSLFRETNETVTLYVVEGDERVCVERIESSQNVRIVESIGLRLKLYHGSGGQAILAFMDKSEIDRILSLAAGEIQDDKVEDEIRTIRQQLDETREKGYSISHGQWLSGASGIAAPIFGSRGKPIGSISISGPSDRFQCQEKIQKYADLLLPAVEKISYEMGYSSVFTSI